jgi:hypothetical protein
LHRRYLLVAAGAAVVSGLPVVSAAAADPAARGRTGGEPARRHGPAPVVDWEWVGGFVTPAWTALRPAQLVAYADGRGIADAERQLRLDRADLGALRAHLATVLADPANLRRRPGAPIIMDAPDTVFAVRTDTGRVYRAQVAALGESRTGRAYPHPLYALLDHLEAVRRRVRATGADYRPAAVRLVVAAVAPPGPSGVRPWPSGVPVPTLDPNLGIGVQNLRGDAARAVAHAIPRGRPASGPWAPYRTTDGRLLSAAWRYLLPHE